MSNILTEKQFQRFIIDYLVNNNDFIERKSDNYNKSFALDKELLFSYLLETQSENVEKLKKIYKTDFEDTIINYINNKIMETSIVEVLKNGIEISNVKLDLVSFKPATSFNERLFNNYSKNIFSIMEEVWINEEQRIDLVIFLNGFAIISFELKCNTSGQNYENAISQYRLERDYKNRLFLFKSGCIVNFAMDLEEVYMTTKLNGEKTYFLPFNMGNGIGIDAGKGNPINPNGFGISYMLEDILTKDTILELLSKFIFVERKEEEDIVTLRKKKSESIIFPRYHQLDCIRKILSDVTENKTEQNYLIQHSAGSGKTYTISWLAHRLASLHDTDNKIIFDNIIIVTDRIVVDRQLQKAVTSIEHKSGLIKIMDDKCTSVDLADALIGNTKIIATTIQKFPYIVESVSGLKNKRFAVIIDEAHSSTSGKEMAAVTKALGSLDEYDGDFDVEEMISNEIKLHGKQENLSVFAFTATPKPTTLELFGRVNKYGQKEAFHLYSMKQAIEEGFILDVLQSFTPYDTFYKINKKIDDDPKYKSNLAKKKIARFAQLHETNIAQRIEIIIEHFRNNVMNELGGKAKAMVVTSSRPEAVKYYNAFKEYVARKGYDDVKPLVAFSGKVNGRQIGTSEEEEYSEASINGFSESLTQTKFDSDTYQVLLVANKYQTGFDQPKLCAMYILKKLSGVNAVQTLSRLNRICPPYDKRTFILDFSNSYETIVNAFKPYYTTTLLSNSVTPELIYEIDNRITEFNILDDNDILFANQLFYNDELNDNLKETKIVYFLSKVKKEYDNREKKEQAEIHLYLTKFVRFYEFLIQVSSFEDNKLHKRYNFIVWLLPYIKIGRSGYGFNLSDKIQASNFYQKKGEEHKKERVISNPNIKLPIADRFNLSEDKEKKLSDIIKEVNEATGKSFDNDVAIKAALQIKDLMMKNEDLKASAKNNTVKDFEFAYFDNIDNALLDGLNQNQDFFTLLLKNEKIRKDILGLFMEEIYKSLRGEK